MKKVKQITKLLVLGLALISTLSLAACSNKTATPSVSPNNLKSGTYMASFSTLDYYHPKKQNILSDNNSKGNVVLNIKSKTIKFYDGEKLALSADYSWVKKSDLPKKYTDLKENFGGTTGKATYHLNTKLGGTAKKVFYLKTNRNVTVNNTPSITYDPKTNYYKVYQKNNKWVFTQIAGTNEAFKRVSQIQYQFDVE